jgi:tight adherence protein B
MLFLVLLLFLTLMSFFYFLTGPPPRFNKAIPKIKDLALPIAGTIAFFFFGKIVFGSSLAGMFWAGLGWYLPPRIIEWLNNKRKKKLHNMAKSFIMTAAASYSTGQTTSEVLRFCASQFPEPFAGEFKNMLAVRNLNEKSSYHDQFRYMAQKYGLQEFNAVAAVIQAAENSGGTKTAAKGLKRLGQALRNRDRLLQERRKDNYEPMLAAIIVLAILGAGLILDVTVLRHLFEESAGKIVLAISSGLYVAMVMVTIATASSKDIA